MPRLLTPELMDDPALDPGEHRRALAGLARLNALARTAPVLWRHLRPLALRLARPVSVLDVATGSADVPIALAALAEREGLALDLHACDLSPTALDAARRRADAASISLTVYAHDATTTLPHRYDAVTCSLFLHHLDEHAAARALASMAAAARHLLLVSDLRRDPFALALAWGASRAVCRSPIVHVDAVKSVRAAFTRGEAFDLARRAALPDAQILPHWPRRMLLRWAPS